MATNSYDGNSCASSHTVALQLLQLLLPQQLMPAAKFANSRQPSAPSTSAAHLPLPQCLMPLGQMPLGLPLVGALCCRGLTGLDSTLAVDLVDLV